MARPLRTVQRLSQHALFPSFPPTDNHSDFTSSSTLSSSPVRPDEYARNISQIYNTDMKKHVIIGIETCRPWNVGPTLARWLLVPIRDQPLLPVGSLL